MKEAEEARVGLYLSLLRNVLSRYGFEPPVSLREVRTKRNLRGTIVSAMNRVLSRWDYVVAERRRFDAVRRKSGLDWPDQAETMIGLERLDNLAFCVRRVLADGIPGDLVETGVWRGGACIFMMGVLRACGDLEKKVWLCDSFEGLPRPASASSPDSAGVPFWEFPELAVSDREVVGNFEKYGLWDEERVRIVKGWFSETLPNAPIDEIALLRLDGDMYDSTMVALRSLYPKVSIGGYCIVDDYGCVPACAQAVDEFRREHRIEEAVERIDQHGVFWRKASPRRGVEA